jgi:hypothetical protein
MKMTPQRIAETRELIAKATAGPWTSTADTDDPDQVVNLVLNSDGDIVAKTWCEDGMGAFEDAQRDGRFIAHARTSLPDALDDLDSLSQQLAAVTAERDMWRALKQDLSVKELREQLQVLRTQTANTAMENLRMKAVVDAAVKATLSAPNDTPEVYLEMEAAVRAYLAAPHQTPGEGTVRRFVVFVEPVVGTDGFLVTLNCGHKLATRKQEFSYDCRECELSPAGETKEVQGG